VGQADGAITCTEGAECQAGRTVFERSPAILLSFFGEGEGNRLLPKGESAAVPVRGTNARRLWSIYSFFGSGQEVVAFSPVSLNVLYQLFLD
jgi:hypothetical protein